jgi:hypothetical protein
MVQSGATIARMEIPGRGQAPSAQKCIPSCLVKWRSSNGCWQREGQTFTIWMKMDSLLSYMLTFPCILRAQRRTHSKFATIQWLLEHGGADIRDTCTTPEGQTMWAAPRRQSVWHLLAQCFEQNSIRDAVQYVEEQLTPLLRAMVLQAAPPPDWPTDDSGRSTCASWKKGHSYGQDCLHSSHGVGTSLPNTHR